MVSREKRALLAEKIGDMVANVPGSIQDLQAPVFVPYDIPLPVRLLDQNEQVVRARAKRGAMGQ